MREKKNKNDNVNDVNGKRDNKKAAGKFKNWTTALSMELREHKSSAIVYFTLRALVIIMLVLQLLNRNYENVFLCILTLLLLVIPSLAQITFKVELPTALEIIILVFIFSAEILGEISEFYLVFPFWDLFVSDHVTLLKVHLITGKTHQIRAHLAAIGHPIIGDYKYGDFKINEAYKKKYGLKTQLLHAYQLCFPDVELVKNLPNRQIIAPVPDLFKKICIDKGVNNNGCMEFKRSSGFDL